MKGFLTQCTWFMFLYLMIAIQDIDADDTSLVKYQATEIHRHMEEEKDQDPNPQDNAKKFVKEAMENFFDKKADVGSKAIIKYMLEGK